MKKVIITLSIILFVLMVSAFILLYKKPELNYETAKCISENSLLYTQKGCIHCETQLEKFGVYDFLFNITDCFYEVDKCVEEGIQKVPTWKIGNETYQGTKTIKELITLTGCEE